MVGEELLLTAAVGDKEETLEGLVASKEVGTLLRLEVGVSDGGKVQPLRMLLFFGVCKRRFTVPPYKPEEGIWEILSFAASQYIAALIPLTVDTEGFFCSSCAITPATCGVAIEVPLMKM